MEKKSPGIRHWIKEESIAEAFQYELSGFPPSLFHNGHMRVAAKRKISNYLCNPLGDRSIVEDRTLTEPNPVTAYDAGMLLHNPIILWKQGIILGSIKDQNVSHLIRLTRQSQEIIVTFNGYLGLQRKAMYNDERHRNSIKTLDIVANDGTVLDLPAKVFLTNPTNKQGFINLLSDKINTKPRLTAKKCSDDANTFIVTTALDALDFHKPVIVKADSTDVLAMCLIASGTKGLFLTMYERNFIILKYSYQLLSLRWLDIIYWFCTGSLAMTALLPPLIIPPKCSKD